jgi:hypothetical protein
MQAREHINPHGHSGDERAVQFFWRSLAILRRLGDAGEQHRLNEAEIDIGNPLGHTDVGIVRRTWMRGQLAGFKRTFNAMVVSLASLMVVGSLCDRRGGWCALDSMEGEQEIHVFPLCSLGKGGQLY